ncbi:MAG: molybdopterin-dependent oxidoreductase, partial [Coriobacteriales bacterium]|nr:molybdopterin-dependent oxidoreductase [Coriobacteriales bacterium]
MGKLSLSRRSFLKVAAATAAAMSLGSTTAFAMDPSEWTEDLRKTDPASSGDVKRIRTACRACGKSECGLFVTVKDGKAIKIEGDESAYHVNGNVCTKSLASMQAAYHPDRILHPMKRTTPKGDKPEFQRISYDEAYSLIYENTIQGREKYGGLTMATMTGTSRFWAMGVWAMGYFLWGLVQDTGAGEVCKGPRRIAGSLTVENGIFFNAGVDMPLVYVQWGTDQTQSNYDDSCRTIVEASRRAQKFISIDPRISNCGKDADYNLTLRPGTDHALALAWTRIVMERELYDDYIMRYWSNGPFLYCEEAERTPGMTGKYNRGFFIEVKTRLLKQSDLVEGGDPLKFMVWNEATDKLVYFNANEEGPDAGMWEGQTEYDIPETGWEYERGGTVLDFPKFADDLLPALWGEYPVTLKDGRQVKCKTAFQKYWDDVVSPWTCEKAAQECDLDAKVIEEACLTWATRIDERRGNGGLNAQLAPEQCGNNIQTFRCIYLLFFMTDNYDVPAGNRGMTRCNVTAGIPQPAFVTVPEGFGPPWYRRAKICGAERYPLTRWTDDEADCSMVWRAANTGDPYPIKVIACGGGDFMNQSNSHYAYEALKQTDFLFTIDLWYCPTAQLSDVLLPACHWLEVPGWARMSQGAHGSMGAHQHCIDAPGEAMCDAYHCHNIYKKWGRPWFNPNEGNMTGWDEPIGVWLDSCVAGEGFTWYEYKETFAKNGWWNVKTLHPKRWGTYRRYMYGYMRQNSGMQMK